MPIASHLTSILGSEFVREETDTIAAAPADTQQISELLRYANEHRLTVSPIGGGTKQSWGNPSPPTNIRLELHRLNRLLEHPWQDLTCTVQAGCTWADMQLALAQHNQFVALDPLFPTRATVGGIVATNDSGALRHRYGSLRDLIIGMTIVLADGTIARTGGKVVKNVAGYDLHKLMTGAFGTLGIITEVTFRLHPIPLHAQTFTVHAGQAQQLAPLIADIRDSTLLTQALQLRGNSYGFHLDIQLNAHPDSDQAALLESMASEIGLGFSPGVDGIAKSGFSPGPLSDIWQARESLFSSQEAFVVKIGILPTDITQIADDIVRLGGTLVAQSLGLIYAACPNIKRDYSALGSLYAYTNAGSMTILQTPSNPLDDPKPPWGPDKPNALTQAIKHQFDRNHILNPNRFLGGI